MLYVYYMHTIMVGRIRRLSVEYSVLFCFILKSLLLLQEKSGKIAEGWKMQPSGGKIGLFIRRLE